MKCSLEFTRDNPDYGVAGRVGSHLETVRMVYAFEAATLLEARHIALDKWRYYSQQQYLVAGGSGERRAPWDPCIVVHRPLFAGTVRLSE